MARVEFRLNPSALAELRTLPGVVAELERHGNAILDEANATLAEGVGYRMASHRGRSKRGPYAVVRVYTSSNHAKYSNAKHDTLVRVVSSR